MPGSHRPVRKRPPKSVCLCSVSVQPASSKRKQVPVTALQTSLVSRVALAVPKQSPHKGSFHLSSPWPPQGAPAALLPLTRDGGLSMTSPLVTAASVPGKCQLTPAGSAWARDQPLTSMASCCFLAPPSPHPNFPSAKAVFSCWVCAESQHAFCSLCMAGPGTVSFLSLSQAGI